MLTKQKCTKAKIRIYPVGIYLLKVKNGNSRIRYVICSKLTKRHRNDLIDMNTLRKIDVALVPQLLTLKRFHTFFWYLILEFWEVLMAGFISRDQSIDK